MNEIYFVLDDLQRPSKEIQEIIGDQSFGSIILQRSTIEARYKEILKSQVWMHSLGICSELKQLSYISEKVKELAEDNKFMHVFSDHVIQSTEKFLLLCQKAQFVRESIAVAAGNTIGAFVFENRTAYLNFLVLRLKGFQRTALLNTLKCNFLHANCFWNISLKLNFLSYISSGFDARFFNSLTGDAFILTKRSAKKEKIKSEYAYYQLLPDQMKMWFVRPFDYIEHDDSAQYSMERYNMTDLAIRWIHGSVSVQEFTGLLEKLFYFIQSRTKKQVDIHFYQAVQRKLYIEKVRTRIEELYKAPFYPILHKFLAQVEIKGVVDSQPAEEMNKVFAKYEALYEAVLQHGKNTPFSVIGHGDLCFSNILYSNEIGLLKFIDPKGALSENDLWTDPYYDLAKLSHSICGRYDFFNAGLYEISLEENLQFKLAVDFDNLEYVRIFKSVLEQNGFSYLQVRLFEVSLFLSMLPLHIEAPKKVFAFILNALTIMEEIEKCLKK